MTPHKKKSNKIARRNRANREKGVRFERKLRRLFELEGWNCRRVLEYDGMRRGQDLCLIGPDGAELPVVIQAKATKQIRDLAVGLSEAIEFNPNGRLFVCVHSYNRRQICLMWDKENPEQPKPVPLPVVFAHIATTWPSARGARIATAASVSFRSFNFLPPAIAQPESRVPAECAEQPSPDSTAPPASEPAVAESSGSA